MHPLRLAEVCPLDPDSAPLARAALARRTAGRHMVVGGYPDAWTGTDPATVLAGLVEAHVMRDASDFFRIRESDAFRTVLRLAAGQAGNLVNVSEWASVAGVSRGAVTSWIDILEQSGVAFLARPFAGGRRAEITGRPKVYTCDSGIRNAIVRCMDPIESRADKGQAFENWVAGQLGAQLSDLAPGDELRFWRSKAGAEVDFVLQRGGATIGIETKATAMRSPALGRSARSFIEAYEPELFVVINLALESEERIGRTVVRWAGPEALLDMAAATSA
jgi:hypothetical protein